MKKKVKMCGVTALTGICGMLLFGRDVNAYIDPSVMTYVIQAIAGAIVAVGAVVGIYFRRAKKKVNDTLGLDENRNKEVEPDEIIVTPNEKK